MILSKISNFLKQNKKIFIYFFFFIAFSYIFSDFAFANEKASTSDWGPKIADGLSEFLKVISLLLGLMSYLVTMFLSPEWINGSLFGMTEKFKDVWILVSNVVYFVFAFILIWIAFMNIIGKTGEQYQLKQALPKFIVGVLIVPFSWFIVQFVLSISAIFTVASISLPLETFPDYKSKVGEITVPQECYLDFTRLGSGESEEASSEASSDNKKSSKPFFRCEEGKGTPLNDLIFGKGGATSSIYGIISIYTYGLLSFDGIAKLSGEVKDIKLIGDLIIKILFDVLFILVYSILMITIGLVLMMRGIYLWLYVMFSPVFGLMYFFGKNEGGGEGFFGKFNVKEFISLALVPVYTMLALSFGLVFMYVVGQGIGEGSTKGTGEIQVSEKAITLGKGEKPFTLHIFGAVSDPKSVTNTMASIGNNSLGVVGTLIMKLLGIVVLWGAVMAALKTSEITKAIAAPIASFGENIGKIAQQMPQNAPIFGGVSGKGMEQIGASASSHFETKSRTTGSDFLKKHELFGESKNVSLTNDSINAITKLKNSNLKDSGVWEGYKKAYDSGKSISELSKNQKFVELLQEMLKKAGKEDEAKKVKFGDINSIAYGHNILNNEAKTNYNTQSGNGFLEGNTSSGKEYTVDKLDELKKSGKGSTTSSSGSNSKLEIKINDQKLNQLFSKENGEKDTFNETDIKDLVTLISTQINKGQVSEEKLSKLIIKDINITDEKIIKKIIEGIKKEDKDYFKEDEKEE